MRLENMRMVEYLKANNIKATPKRCWHGSMRGTWRIYRQDEKWTPELIEKFSLAGFVNYNNLPIDKYAGNGGDFQVFVRLPEIFERAILEGVTPPAQDSF